MSGTRFFFAALFAAVLVPAGLAAQGTVTGTVSEAGTGEPISGAQIVIAGTNVGSLTNSQGEFTVPGVPAGVQTVRVTRIGYSAASQSVSVSDGGTATANFALEESVVELDAVVVTATGEQLKRELANAISNIDAAEIVDEAPVFSLDELLTGRAAGVSILQSSGTTGATSRIRIRGSTSISLSNEPIVIIDGVRAYSAQGTNSIGVGGQSTNRLNDISVQNIESMEIVKGPSAATLYGTDAANGVILITTKQGGAGAPRWNVYGETGWLTDENEYPLNYFGEAADGSRCLAFQVGAGSCTQAQLVTHQPLNDEEISPLATGNRQQYGVNVAGGGQDLTYFVSAEYEDEVGVFELPDFYRDQLLETQDELPESHIHPNSLERVSIRANLGARIAEGLNLNVNTGYITSDVFLPQNDNNALGILPSGYLGFPFDTEDFNFGWGFLTPAQNFAIEINQEVERYITGANLNWQPTSWFTGRATFGLDNTTRHDNGFSPVGAQPFDPFGFRISNRIQVRNYTVDLGGTASFDLTPSISSRSSVGSQFLRDFFQGTFAFGEELGPGTKTVGAAANQFADEATTEDKTFGLFAEQQFGWNDRLFVTGGLRADDHSAFGQDFDLIVYPKFGVSYVALDNQDAPWFNFFNSLRLRGAWGASGRAPGATDALTFFNPVSATVAGSDVAAITFGDLGNVELEAERSEELELGFDAGFFDGRLGLEVTWYDKNTEDLLVQVPLPPSLGVSSSRFENLGEVENKGWEVAVNAVPVSVRNFEWDFNLTASNNQNELIELGLEADSILFNPQRFQEGFPLGGYFTRELTFDDADGDGIIDLGEFSVADSATFIGSAFPETELSLRSSLTLFNLLRVSGMLDYRGDYYQENFTEQFRCFFVICRGLHDTSAPLLEQARALESVLGTAQAFVDDASFWKLRELGFTFLVPERWAGWFGANNASLVVTGRNLATWTDYTGIDPELNAAATANFSNFDFLTQPPVRTWIVRLNLGF